MPDRLFNVLFLCTGNSARSILAEAWLNAIGGGRFRGFSAGSHPAGNVNPFAEELLRRNGIAIEGLRSKAWDEFAEHGAPKMDVIIKVCDQAAGEVCPVWPGHPAVANWGVEDPAAVTGDDETRRAAFAAVFAILQKRIGLFTALPLDSLEAGALRAQLSAIGSER